MERATASEQAPKGRTAGEPATGGRPSPSVEVTSLVKRYGGVEAVRGVSFTVPSRSGATTRCRPSRAAWPAGS